MIFKRKGTKLFYTKVKVKNSSGKIVYKNVSTGEAKKRLARLVAIKLKDEYGKTLKKPEGNLLFISELLDLYFEKTKRSKSEATLKREKSTRKILKNYFGHLRLEELTRKIIDDHIESRLSQIKKLDNGQPVYITNRTVRAELILLQHAFNLASKDWDLIDFNPFDKITLPKAKRTTKRFLDFDEQDLFISNIEEKYRAIFIVAFDTGLRRRNINELSWKQVDFKNNLLHIEDTKNNESITVPMTNRVFETLTYIKEKTTVHLNWVFFNEKAKKKYHPDTFTDIARRAADKLGWSDINFHTARHSFCSMLAINGATQKDIMDAAGHKDAKTSSDYTKINLERKIETIGKLEPANKTKFKLTLNQ